MAEVTKIDPGAREVHCGAEVLPYDFLILATGATHAYFGNDDWAEDAPGLKTIADALTALQNRFDDIDLGSYPFNDEGRYGTTLVARGTDEARLDTVLEALRQLIIDHGAEPLARS